MTTKEKLNPNKTARITGFLYVQTGKQEHCFAYGYIYADQCSYRDAQ